MTQLHTQTKGTHCRRHQHQVLLARKRQNHSHKHTYTTYETQINGWKYAKLHTHTRTHTTSITWMNAQPIWIFNENESSLAPPSRLWSVWCVAWKWTTQWNSTLFGLKCNFFFKSVQVFFFSFRFLPHVWTIHKNELLNCIQNQLQHLLNHSNYTIWFLPHLKTSDAHWFIVFEFLFFFVTFQFLPINQTVLERNCSLISLSSCLSFVQLVMSVVAVLPESVPCRTHTHTHALSLFLFCTEMLSCCPSRIEFDIQLVSIFVHMYTHAYAHADCLRMSTRILYNECDSWTER